MISFYGSRMRSICIGVIVLWAVTGCTTTQSTTDQILESGESQVMLRQMQTRSFDTLDKTTTMRSVISTLQDLDFLIENADAQLGSVTAQKIYRDVATKITVTTREGQANQMLVRANAQYGLKTRDESSYLPRLFHGTRKSNVSYR
jgi:hypothetical protein